MEQLPIGLRFSIIHRYVRKRTDELLREQGLTGVQLGVLMQLDILEHEGVGDINQRLLEDAAHVTHPTMTEIIKRLEKKGFIRCEVNAADKRSKCIFSTEKAKSLRNGVRDGGEAVFRELSTALSEPQLAALEEITGILVDSICEKEFERKE